MYSPELELIAEFLAEILFAKNLPKKIRLAELTAEFFSTKKVQEIEYANHIPKSALLW